MVLVRYRYRPAPVQPELVNGKGESVKLAHRLILTSYVLYTVCVCYLSEGGSLSLAKLEKPIEEEPIVYASAPDEPAYLPSQTQTRRTEYIVSSDEEKYRKQHYPSIIERASEQKAWAEQKSLESKFNNMMNDVKDSKLEDMDLCEKKLNDLLKESEKNIINSGGTEASQVLTASIARQILELKEKKVLATVHTMMYHKRNTAWQRWLKAITLRLGLLRKSVAQGEATLVLPWLLIGRRELAADLNQLIALHVTHILNMTHDCPNFFPHYFVYDKLGVRDSTDTDLAPLFGRITAFIQRTEDCKGRILVHCSSGTSRAPSAVLAYLLLRKKLALVDAYNLLTRLRPAVHPNTSFLYQLAMLEVEQCGHCSVYWHPHWRFFELHAFRAQGVPGRRSLGAAAALSKMYETRREVEGSTALKELFDS
jgi:protein-tyrosine phosphatase